jgi:hypothetical protein
MYILKEKSMKFSYKARFWLVPGILFALVVSITGATYAHEQRELGKYQLVVGFIVEPAYEGQKNGLDLRVTKLEEGEAEGEMTMDLEEHGAIFSSPALAQGETFTFEVTHDLEDLTIPYHNHLNHEMTGSITVSQDAELSGTAEIEIHDGAFHPADITVQPETILEWTNDEGDPQAVTSGVMAEPGHTHEEAVVEVPVEGLETSLQAEITHVSTGVSKTLDLRTIFREPGHYTADLMPTAPGVYQFRIFGTIEDLKVDETFVSEGGGGGFGDIQSSGELQFPQKVTEVREVEGAVRGAQDTAQQAQVTAVEADGKASSARTLGIIGIVLGAVGIASGVGGAAVGMRRK